MKCLVCFTDRCDVIAVQYLAEMIRGSVELFQFLFVHPLACELDCQLFQSPPDLEHIPQIFLRDLSYFRTFPGDHEHKPLQLQLADCLPDRRAAHSQFVGELDFHQTLARL